jgi:hypothetical protein
MEEITKYCQFLEKRDKLAKAKPKPKINPIANVVVT